MFPQINDIWIENVNIIFIIFYYCKLFKKNTLLLFFLFNFLFIIIIFYLFLNSVLDIWIQT